MPNGAVTVTRLRRANSLEGETVIRSFQHAMYVVGAVLSLGVVVTSIFILCFTQIPFSEASETGTSETGDLLTWFYLMTVVSLAYLTALSVENSKALRLHHPAMLAALTLAFVIGATITDGVHQRAFIMSAIAAAAVAFTVFGAVADRLRAENLADAVILTKV